MDQKRQSPYPAEGPCRLRQEINERQFKFTHFSTGKQEVTPDNTTLERRWRKACIVWSGTSGLRTHHQVEDLLVMGGLCRD